MQTQYLSIHGHRAPLRVWDSKNQTQHTPLHFAHGNGFPAGTYDAMLQKLSNERHVFALEHRAIWEGVGAPSTRFSWGHAADDLIAAIEQVAPSGVIGVGHSLGGVMTLLAAAKRPDLFHQIILIEPVMFPTRAFVQMGWMPMWLRGQLFSVAKRTARRRATWSSQDEFVDYHIDKPAFRGISREVMMNYAQHGLHPRNGALQHSFPTSWEAHIFRSPAYVWRAVAKLSVPCTIFRAEQSQWIPDVSWQKWQKMRPDYPVTILPKLGHMAPLQNPDAMATAVLNALLDKTP
jgi:pimeloyl-ACP methyl ester carboxylesterase